MEERAGERRFYNQLASVGRHVTVILHPLQNLNTARASMQCFPDSQPHAFTISSPLMIPIPQLLDSLRGEKLFSRLVSDPLLRKAVLESIQFNREACNGAVAIEEISSQRMLAAEFESSEPPGMQRSPKRLFFLRLVASQTSRSSSRIHARQRNGVGEYDKF